MARLGRPKAGKFSHITFRLTESEYTNLRKIAIADNISMTDFFRKAIARRKKTLQEAGKWPETAERGVDDGNDGGDE